MLESLNSHLSISSGFEKVTRRAFSNLPVLICMPFFLSETESPSRYKIKEEDEHCQAPVLARNPFYSILVGTWAPLHKGLIPTLILQTNQQPWWAGIRAKSKQLNKVIWNRKLFSLIWKATVTDDCHNLENLLPSASLLTLDAFLLGRTTAHSWTFAQIHTVNRALYQDNEAKLVLLFRESLGIKDLKDK